MVMRVRELVTKYDMDIAKLPSNFRAECKNVITGQFKNEWATKNAKRQYVPYIKNVQQNQKLIWHRTISAYCEEPLT